MRRFFVDSNSIVGDTVEITGSDVKHIRDVLRMRLGDKIICIDGSNVEMLVEISEFTAGSVIGKIERRESGIKEAEVRITLAQSVPKSDKMEQIIKMCTELGIFEIIPVTSERVIIQGDFSKKIVRWQKIAEEAAKQSGRTYVPTVRPAEKFASLLGRLEGWDKALMPWEVHKENTIGSALQKEKPKKIILFIGPEGGYSYTEAESAKTKGAVLVTLGSRILRVETAAPVALALTMREYGEM